MDMGLVVVCDCSLYLIFCVWSGARDLMLRLRCGTRSQSRQVCSRWNNGVVDDVI